MNLEWLLDEHTTFHFSFDQVYFGIGSALERLHSAKHQVPCRETLQSPGH